MSAAQGEADEDWPAFRDRVLAHAERLRNDDTLLQALGLRPAPPDNVVEFAPAAPTQARSGQDAGNDRPPGGRGRRQRQFRRPGRDPRPGGGPAGSAQQRRSGPPHRRGRQGPLRRGRRGDRHRRTWTDAGRLARPALRPDRPGAGTRRPGPHGPPPGRDRAVRRGGASISRAPPCIRIALWNPVRFGILGFGSNDPAGFTREMGAELVAFIARVVERTAERWPVVN